MTVHDLKVEREAQADLHTLPFSQAPPPLVSKPSRVHGMGLFATEDIKKVF
jgi:hypothetical protein